MSKNSFDSKVQAEGKMVQFKKKGQVSSSTFPLIDVLLGPILFCISLTLLPSGMFPYAAKGAIGTLLWMGFWWIKRPVHIGITGFIPIVVCALFDFIPVSKILPSYSSPIIMLILGADMLTVSWALWGLDKRISLKALSLIGSNVKQQIVVWFVVPVVLSIFLPNVVVTAIMVPIAVAMLKFVGLGDDIGNNQIATAILLAIAWGAGLGGFGSPLGGAMNLLTIEYIEKMVIHREYMYFTWVIRMLPILAVCTIVVIGYLLTMKFEQNTIPGSKDFFVREYKALPPVSRAEKWNIFLFLLATGLAFFRPMYKSLIPSFAPAFAFLICGLSTFMIPSGSDNKPISTWKYACPKLMWGLYFLFGGGIALGKLISLSGAGDVISQIITRLPLSGGFLTIVIFVILGSFLSNISSDTAAVAISIPIIINVVQAMGLNPMAYIYITSAACNLAFILPTSVRAIPVGYGLDPGKLLSKGGMALVLACLATILLGFFLTTYWAGFSLA